MKPKEKIILDLCGGTGAWSKPYKEAGYDVRLITLPDYDVRLFQASDFRKLRIYGVLAAPPCTHFAGSGAMWWKGKGTEKLLEGLSVVDACLRIIYWGKPKFWVLENPVGRLVHYLGKPKMYFNPCDYGDAYTKKTCLWGEFNIPEKNPVKPIFMTTKNGKRYSPVAYNTGGKSERTKMLRSITPPGFAKAFFEANQ